MNDDEGTQVPRELSVDEDDDGRRVVLASGDELRVSLAEPGSGGYRWHMAVEEGGPLNIIEAGFTPALRAVGSGGRAWWRLRAAAAGTVTLVAHRSRQWQCMEGDARWRLAVEIRPAAC